VTEPRHYTEHSPVVVEMKEKLYTEWATQKATREGKRPYRPQGKSVETVMTRAALMCVRSNIDPAKLVAAALRNAEHGTIVQPSFLLDIRTLGILNNNTGVDSEGNEHALLTTQEANYRAEWGKARAMLAGGIPVVHALDPVNGLRPLIRWALATKMGLDTTSVFLDAAAEYRRNHDEADAVFGHDFFKVLL